MKHLKFIGIIALIAVIGFAIVSCDDGSGPSPSDPSGKLIEGQFASQTGSGNAVFFADYASGSASLSVSRSVAGMASTDKELTGKIQDGDIIFNLSGVYDSVSKRFFLSAGSSFLVFEIAGTLSSSGTMSDATATIKVKDNNDWIITNVTVTSASDTSIDGNASNQQVAGIPSSWFGRWKFEGDDDSIFVMTAYQLTDITYDFPMGFVDITGTGNSRTVIWTQVEVYEWADSDGNSGREVGDTKYFKVVIQETGNGGLQFSCYGTAEKIGEDDDGDDIMYGGIWGYDSYAEANAISTSGSPAMSVVMIRP